MLGPRRYAELLMPVYEEAVPLHGLSGKRVLVQYKCIERCQFGVFRTTERSFCGRGTTGTATRQNGIEAMKILTMVPIQSELDFLLQAWAEKGFHTQTFMIGKLLVMHLPELDVTLACGGLGKVQFAVQTQYLLDVCPGWDLVICAGAAGVLVDGLSIGDVVVATETVEHDIHNKFGKSLLPRFGGAEIVVSALRSVLPLSSSFQVHFGPIASGDEDVVDTDRKRMLHRRTGALAVA